jgi:bifunctional enzyme CysN/CysC
MHSAAPVPIAPKRILRFSISGAPGHGSSTLIKQLIAAAEGNLAASRDRCQTSDADRIKDGALYWFASGQRTFVLERAICAAPTSGAISAPVYDFAVIVSDVSKGLIQEARQQVAIASMIGVRHLVIALNKIDLVGWDQKTYERVAAAFAAYTANFGFATEITIPLSALFGANIRSHSANMPWYGGPSLMSYLERVEFDQGPSKGPLRLPITAVSRPDPDRRRYHGTIASGQILRGDTIQVAVSGVASTVERIFVDEKEREQANAGESIGVELSSHIDLGRGEMLVHPAQRPHVADQFAAHIVWISAEPLLPGRDYTLSIGTKEVTACVTALKHRVELETLHQVAARTLERGEVGACTIATAALPLDAFTDVPQTGRFSLSDRTTYRLIAAGTIDFALRRGENVHLQPLSVSKYKRALLKAQKPCILWFTGLSGAGKSTVANLVEHRLVTRGFHTYLLDGDNVRHGLNKNLGFTAADRVENIRRVGEVAKLFVDAGLIVLCSFISPFRAERAAVRGLVSQGEFIEVFVRAPLEVCERRDPKGLYAKSRAGDLPNFTGIDSPYEEPEGPDLVLDTTSAFAAALAGRVVALLEARELIAAAVSKNG